MDLYSGRKVNCPPPLPAKVSELLGAALLTSISRQGERAPGGVSKQEGECKVDAGYMFQGLRSDCVQIVCEVQTANKYFLKFRLPTNSLLGSD